MTSFSIFPPKTIKFRYVNWKDEEHEYVIDAGVFELGIYMPDDTGVPRWQLHGQVVTRDGDIREDMDPSRRRTFLLEKIKEIEEVEV